MLKNSIGILLFCLATLALAQTTELTLADGSKTTVKTDASGTLITRDAGTKNPVLTATRETNHGKAVQNVRTEAEQSKNPVSSEAKP